MSFLSRLRTGLALPSLTVALTPARAATSHMRRRYHERYRGRYRFPALLFGIDFLVLSLVCVIFGVGVWFALWKPAPEPGLRLIFSAPPLITATTIAFEARVSAQDNQTHSAVRLRWVLPPGTEVVSSAPSADQRNETWLGDLAPGEERVARLAVRLIAPPGSARIGFQLRSGNELVSGSEIRPIVGSALTLEPLVNPLRSETDERILRLRNQGNAPLACARVRTDAKLTHSWDVENTSSGILSFGTLAPREDRWFVISLEGAPRNISLLCGQVELARLTLAPVPKISSAERVHLNIAPSTPGQETWMDAQASSPFQLLVHHPSLKATDDRVRWFDVTSGTARIVLPLDTQVLGTATPHAPRWFALPLERTQEGVIVRGPVQEAPITTAFSLASEARYYAASGGQIGAGPLPPRVGEPTRYWVQWKLLPTQADLSAVEIRATLPPNVTWTGQEALPAGGTLVQEEGDIVWRTPFLAATLEPITVAFEIRLAPGADTRGTEPALLRETRARALENRSNVLIQARASGLNTSLLNDERAKGQGTVR